jgi:integrase/recombinase XerC
VADREGAGPSVASLVLVAGVPLLHPEPQVFEAMLEGWGNQMLARNLAAATIRIRLHQVREAGATWKRYAAGNHTPTRQPQIPR